jgi:N-acetylneuraminate synthase
MEFSQEQWSGLREHAKSRNIAFGTSCFSHAAVELIRTLDVDYWKIGSGEIFSMPLLSLIGGLSKPVLISTGLGGETELSDAVDTVKRGGAEVGIFQCTSKYPTKMTEIGLNLIDDLRSKYDFPVGLSDHSGVIWPSIAALARGAELIEFHLAFHKSQFGPDTASSLVPEQVLALLEARDSIATMLSSPMDGTNLTSDQRDMRALFGKSLSLVKPLAAGHVITQENLTLKKPAGGIPASDISKIIGRVLSADKTASRLLRWEDLA